MRGFHQQGPRNRHALPLSSGKSHAAFPHDRVISICEAFNEFMRLGGFGSSNNLFHGRLGAAIGNIRLDGVREQQRGLQYNADLFS